MATSRHTSTIRQILVPKDNVKHSYPRFAIFSIILSILAALYSITSQLNLSPTYGSYPSALYHDTGIALSVALAFIAKKVFIEASAKHVAHFIPVHAFTVPALLHFPVFRSLSHLLGPRLGPLVTELFTFYPLVFASTYVLLDRYDKQFGVAQHDPGNSALFRDIILSTIYYAAQRAWSLLFRSHVQNYMGTSFLLTRWGLQLFTASCYAMLFPSKLLLAIVPAVIFMFQSNTHAPLTFTTMKLNRTLAQNGFILLERQESITGYISVLENQKDQFRALRCDHSLLGGEWLATPERLADGIVVPEPIYSVFTMLEAVRLMVRNDTEPPMSAEKTALVIGLGIGTCPSAFVAHGINTTAVEIDPALGPLATRYFNLPQNLSVVNEDATAFVKGAARQEIRYDYIVHDVFTGGVEPTSLFTSEFLTELRTLLKPDGTVAVNYAGDLNMLSTSIILNTISNVFPDCRIFRDNLPQADAESDFLNMIVFCTAVATQNGWHFRDPIEADYLRSQARRHSLVPRHEIQWSELPERSKILSLADTKEVEQDHSATAIRHWNIMRQVLPDVVWENW